MFIINYLRRFRKSQKPDLFPIHFPNFVATINRDECFWILGKGGTERSIFRQGDKCLETIRL